MREKTATENCLWGLYKIFSDRTVTTLNSTTLAAYPVVQSFQTSATTTIYNRISTYTRRIPPVSCSEDNVGEDISSEDSYISVYGSTSFPNVPLGKHALVTIDSERRED